MGLLKDAYLGEDGRKMHGAKKRNLPSISLACRLSDKECECTSLSGELGSSVHRSVALVKVSLRKHEIE